MVVHCWCTYCVPVSARMPTVVAVCMISDVIRGGGGVMHEKGGYSGSQLKVLWR